METLDAAVIGAGAVGLAVAARLAGPGREVAVFERHGRHGLETSSRNSEVLHAGFYYPTGSLKARLCVAGRRALYELSGRQEFFTRRCGKLVLALDQAEREKLAALLAQGRANGVEGLELVDAAAVHKLSGGAAKASAALWSPETGILDSEELMRFFLGRAQDRGAMFAPGAALTRVERAGGAYKLWRSGETDPVTARCVVNAAGLASDEVAALAGIDVDAAGYRLRWFKGEYFSLRRPLPASCLLYPLPGPHGLGIHLTVDRRGQQRLGPSSFAVDRLDYEVDASHAGEFFQAAGRYLPGLKREDVTPGTAGIRPKLSADGSFRDFVIAEESARNLPGWVNLIGIESPGLTASPAIAELVADLLEWPS